MIVAVLRRGLACLALAGLLWIGATLTGQPARGQDTSAELSLDALFDEALRAVTIIENPEKRIRAALALAKPDAERGGARLEKPLIAIIREALPLIAANRYYVKTSDQAGLAEALIRYGRSSEAVAAMRELKDSSFLARYVLRLLVKNGDVDIALRIAQRPVEDHYVARAMLVIVNALREAGERQKAYLILMGVARIVGSLTRIEDQKMVAGEYVAALAHFDPEAAEQTAFSVKGTQRDDILVDLVGAYAKMDPGRALKLAAKIKDKRSRAYAFTSLIRATVRDPDRQRIYKKALKKAPRLSRARALADEVKRAMRDGDLERARNRLDALDALVPKLPKESRGAYLPNAATRLSLRALAGDPEIVFREIDDLPYGHGFDRQMAVWMIARDLQQYGQETVARRLNESIRGDSNYVFYFIGAIYRFRK